MASNLRVSKNDIAWDLISDQTNFLQEIEKNGFSIMSAKDIQKWGNYREPRLMTKLDFDIHRPKLFKQNDLNILPLKRGEYVVFKDPENICYFKLPSVYEDRRAKVFESELDFSRLDTLSTTLCSTESDALDRAYLSGLIADFCKVPKLTKTKSGRFGSSAFELQLPNCGKILTVENSQLEVDGIYESSKSVVLVEAKIGFHPNFHIRQLYYPYTWLQTKTEKPIIPLLLCHSNGDFQLNQFKLGSKFGDIALEQQNYYVINEYATVEGSLSTVDRNLPSPQEDFDTPFPQADDLDKVVDVLRQCQKGIKDSQKLALIFGFDERQSGYYKNAAKYLGLLDSSFSPTELGKRLLTEKYKLNRTEIILKCMLVRPPLREAIAALQAKNYDANAVELSSLMLIIEKYRPKKFTENTLRRRSNTLRNWLRWLVANYEFRH